MNVTQEDFELLEAKLDGELNQAEESALAARLAREAELAQALEALRGERVLRAEYFAALEPNDGQAGALAGRICDAVSELGRPVAAGRHWSLRWVVAAAACLLVGFIAGWMGHLRLHGDQMAVKPADSDVKTVVSYQVALHDDAGGVIAVQNFDTLEKAQAFERDVQLWQERKAQSLKGPLPLAAETQF